MFGLGSWKKVGIRFPERRIAGGDETSTGPWVDWIVTMDRHVSVHLFNVPAENAQVFLGSASRRASTFHGDRWPFQEHLALPGIAFSCSKSSFDRSRSGITKHSAAVCRRPSPGDDRPAALCFVIPDLRDHIPPSEDTNDLRQERLERNFISTGDREKRPRTDPHLLEVGAKKITWHQQLRCESVAEDLPLPHRPAARRSSAIEQTGGAVRNR
jgi:hypothetical protein